MIKKNFNHTGFGREKYEISMGMKSLHKFHNHNIDNFYKEALTKLVRQYIT